MLLCSRELRELKERESQEISRLNEEQSLAKEREHHFKCFIEDLSGHELYEKLFEETPLEEQIFAELKDRYEGRN